MSPFLLIEIVSYSTKKIFPVLASSAIAIRGLVSIKLEILSKEPINMSENHERSSEW